LIQHLKTIEETTLNAWPGLQQILYDGWLLRFAEGYTRRANSVNPIYSGRLDVTTKIGRCERIYGRRHLTPVFKLSPFVQPAHLDELLAKRGYRHEAPTSVQWLDLAAIPAPTINSVGQWSRPSPEWRNDYVRLNRVSSPNVPALSAILHNIVPETNYMTLKPQQQAVACGLAVREGHYVGLFDIVTDPHQRSQGYGTQLVLNLLAWAKQRGAKKAYLQVMLNNEPALKLYAKLGFREIYQYWYRVWPEDK
jgi:ribosomal protein S18 acetylase RimI-like enzyme